MCWRGGETFAIFIVDHVVGTENSQYLHRKEKSMGNKGWALLQSGPYPERPPLI